MLLSESEYEREVLRTLVGLSTVEEVKQMIRSCIDAGKMATTFEAKQFILGLTRANRPNDANAIATFLNQDYNVRFHVSVDG